MVDILSEETIKEAMRVMDRDPNLPKTLYVPCKCGNAVDMHEKYCPRCKRKNRFWIKEG